MRACIFFLVVASIATCTSSGYAADETLPNSVSLYLKEQGPIATLYEENKEPSAAQKTFYNAARNKLVEYFCIDENLPGGEDEGASNPANVHCEVALFNKKSGNWILGDELSLGQGSVVEFNDNVLVTETVEYGEEDAMCCPSVKRKKVFYIRDGKFTDARP